MVAKWRSGKVHEKIKENETSMISKTGVDLCWRVPIFLPSRARGKSFLVP